MSLSGCWSVQGRGGHFTCVCPWFHVLRIHPWRQDTLIPNSWIHSIHCVVGFWQNDVKSEVENITKPRQHRKKLFCNYQIFKSAVIHTLIFTYLFINGGVWSLWQMPQKIINVFQLNILVLWAIFLLSSAVSISN